MIFYKDQMAFPLKTVHLEVTHLPRRFLNLPKKFWHLEHLFEQCSSMHADFAYLLASQPDMVIEYRYQLC